MIWTKAKIFRTKVRRKIDELGRKIDESLGRKLDDLGRKLDE